MMKLDSPWFDRIRSTRRRNGAQKPAVADTCEWPGCACTGGFRAPKGRHMEGSYHNFCQEHARQYNQSYNYFADMPDEKIAEWQKADFVGHRPTWNMGVRNGTREAQSKSTFTPESGFRDPFGFFNGARQGAPPPDTEEVRAVRNAERQAFEQLGLETNASPTQIKTQFKALAKRLHPDANGGDRSTEGKLQEVIQAYNYLKQNGFC
jgi:hypothetical protein